MCEIGGVRVFDHHRLIQKMVLQVNLALELSLKTYQNSTIEFFIAIQRSRKRFYEIILYL